MAFLSCLLEEEIKRFGGFGCNGEREGQWLEFPLGAFRALSMEEAEKRQTWHCSSGDGGGKEGFGRVRSLFVHRVGGRMELLQTVVALKSWI